MASSAGARRRRQRTEVAQLPTPVEAEPDEEEEPEEAWTNENIAIHLRHPGYFAKGKHLITNASVHEADVSVNAPLEVLQEFLAALERCENLEFMLINNRENTRPGQHIVEALLQVALTNKNVQDLTLSKCVIGFQTLGAVVSSKRCIGLLNCRCDADLALADTRDELVGHWKSNRKLQRLQIHQTFDTDFLGALFRSLYDLPNLDSVEIGITNATLAGHMAAFLMAPRRKRPIDIILNDSRFDDATVSRLLAALSETKFSVTLYFTRCCWKARPETTATEARDLYESFMNGLDRITRIKRRASPELEDTFDEDMADCHKHARLRPFDDELERGHCEETVRAEMAIQAAAAVASSLGSVSQQPRKGGKKPKKGKRKKRC